LRRATRALSLALTPVLLLGSALMVRQPVDVGASSHREAPLIAFDPQADNTDVYAFISPDRTDTVTLIANYIPLQDAYGGPNYFLFGDDVLYTINVDTTGDAQPNVSYEFRFSTVTSPTTTFLYNTAPIAYNAASDSYDGLVVTQRFTVTEVVSATTLASTRRTVLGSGLLTPPINVGGAGSKSTPNYDALVPPTLHTIKIGSNNEPTGTVDNSTPSTNDIRVFAGQRDDAFFVDLSSIFDLLTLRPQNPPIGYDSGPTAGYDGVRYANTHSLVIQVPLNRLNGANSVTGNNPETVIGVWATASRQTTTVIGALNSRTSSGDFVQVSRLGMPLTNEVVIPRALKDAFNSIPPSVDAPLYTQALPGLEAAGALLQESVEDPELGNLLCTLYGVPLPKDTNNDCRTEYTPGTILSGRADIFDIFLRGMVTTKPFTITAGTTAVSVPAGTNVNRPANVVPADMLRLNTAVPFRPSTAAQPNPQSLCKATPDYQLGLLGGDVCGFPNGRRLADDVTDIEVLAVAGAAYSVLTNDTFNFNPALIGILDDGVSQNDKPLLTTFPYLASPWGGKEVGDIYINKRWFNIIARNASGPPVRALKAE
jgi:hypothetical protein